MAREEDVLKDGAVTEPEKVESPLEESRKKSPSPVLLFTTSMAYPWDVSLTHVIVSMSVDPDSKSVSYAEITATLIKTVQTLMKRVDELSQKLEGRLP